MSSVRREAALNRMHKVTLVIQKQQTVQVEFRRANSDETGQAEVSGAGGEEAVRGLGIFRLVDKSSRVRLQVGEAARRGGAVFLQRRRVGGKRRSANVKRIEYRSLGRTDIQFC